MPTGKVKARTRAGPAEEREVTFLFSDLEASTRLLAALGPRYPEMLERHWSIVRDATSARGGQEFGAEGDAMFFAFDEPAAAVAAAVAVQHAHDDTCWPDDLPVRVRVAVHRGRALPALGTWLGVAVHQTARTCAAGHGGQILVSADAAAAIGSTTPLPHGATVVDLGEYELRDIPGVQRLFQVVAPGLRPEFPPLRTRSASRTNLPHQRTTFVGRLRERDDLARLAEPGRLLTIVGPGGAGKTRLALEVAGHVGPRFGDGAWVIELAGLSRDDDVAAFVSATLQSLGVLSAPGAQASGETMAGWVADALCDRSLVLVLDNCEHVIEGAARLADAITARARQVAVLATSREPLAVAGEVVWRIPALDGTAAARLFLDRVAAARGSGAVVDDVAAVATLCDRLDGMPLAVELAASRAATLGVDAIVSSLDHRLSLLSGGARTAQPRQRSLHALVDWSYELLARSEQAMLRSLAPLPASFGVDIAERVAPAGIDVLAAVDGLVRKSMLVSEVTEVGGGRYRLLETVRVFALERLAAAGESTDAHRRLTAGLLDLLDLAVPKLSGPDQAMWLDRIDADLPSFRVALEWNLEHDPALALSLAGRLGQVFGIRGALAEGRSWVERALAATAHPPSPALVQALAAAGTLSRMQGELVTARAHHERQLAVAESLEVPGMVAGSLSALGNVLLLLGDLDAAAEVFETSYRLRVEIADDLGVMRSLNNLGVLAGRRGDYRRAEECYLELVERARARADMRMLGQTLHNLADVHASTGRLSEAVSLLDEALAHLSGIGDRRSVGITTGLRAAVARRQGDLVDALRGGERALEHLTGVGDPIAVGLVVDGLAATVLDLVDRAPSGWLASRDATQRLVELLTATARLPDGRAERGLTEEESGHRMRAELRARLGPSGYDALVALCAPLDLDALVDVARQVAAEALTACETG